MIVYNVTVGIDSDIEEEWVRWMLDVHIPDVLASGMFEKYEMYKVLSHEDEGESYAIQYHSSSLSQVEMYLSDYAPDLIRKHMERFKDRHVAFRTILERVE